MCTCVYRWTCTGEREKTNTTYRKKPMSQRCTAVFKKSCTKLILLYNGFLVFRKQLQNSFFLQYMFVSYITR